MTTAVEQDLFSFGICNPEKHVERITYEQTKPFILGIHYARRMPTVQYAFGLFDGGYLVGVVTYGQPATPSIGKGLAGIENKHNVLELNRLVILPTYEKKNAASYLVSHSLKMLPPHTFVVSYADVGGVGTHRTYLSGHELSLHGNDKAADRYYQQVRTRKAL